MSKRLPSLSVDTTKIEKLVHYGQALAQMGMQYKALQQYDVALEFNPKSPIVFHQKGLLYFQKGQYIHALRCYEQALQQSNYFNVFFDKGNAHLALNQIEQAINCYEQAATFFPNKKEIYYQLAIAHYQNKSQSSVLIAFKYLAQALKIEPNYVCALQKQADIYYDLKLFKKALKLYSQVINLDTLNYKAHYSKGLIYFEMNEKEKAQKKFDECILIQPQNSLPYYNKGIIFLQQNEPQEALKQFKLSIKRNPKNEKVRYHLGLTYQQLGKYDKAIEHYSKCQITHEILYYQGLIQQQFKIYHKSQELFKKAIQIKQDNQNYWYSLGINYFYLDNMIETVHCFEKVIVLGGNWIIEDLKPKHPAIISYQNQFLLQPTTYIEYYKQGRIFCLLQQFKKAETSFKKCLQLHQLIDAKIELAKVYESLKQYKESIQLYLEINQSQSLIKLIKLLQYLNLHQGVIIILNKLDIQNKDIEIIYNKGLSLAQLFQYQQAIQCFDDVLKIQPRYVEAILQKGLVYKEIGEQYKAQIQFNKIIHFEPENEYILLLQGHSHFHQDKFKEAISCYERAIKMNESFSEAYFGLGFTHYTQKEYFLAIATYKKYLIKTPKSKQFLLALSNALHKIGKNKSALKKLDEITEENCMEVLYCKGTIYYDTQKYRQSFIYFQRAIKLRPVSNELLQYLQ